MFGEPNIILDIQVWLKLLKFPQSLDSDTTVLHSAELSLMVLM